MIERRRFSRFRLGIFAAIERAAVLLGGRRFYRWRYLRQGRLQVRELELGVQGLPGALEGLVIAHLSDLHAGPFVGPGDLGHVAALIEELRPDVVCWTGDYVVHGVENLQGVLPELGRCVGQLATFAVLGNHDYKGRREAEIQRDLEPHGWVFLNNSSRTLEVDGARIAFAGIEDPEEGKVVDVDAAMAGTASADVVIGLSHGPLMAPEFAERHPNRPDSRPARAVLSGHTHGTQIDLPFLRDLGPAHPGLWVELGATTLIVSRGLGVVGAPFRTGVPAEMALITLRAAPHAPPEAL